MQCTPTTSNLWLRVATAWSCLQRHVPCIAMAAGSARWPQTVGKGHGASHPAREMLLDLSAAWLAITAPPRAFTFHPQSQTHRRVPEHRPALSVVFLQQGAPWSHPKDVLRRPPKGVVQFASQMGRALVDATSAKQSKVHSSEQALLDYEPHFQLVESRSHAVDFSKASGRQVVNEVGVRLASVGKEVLRLHTIHNRIEVVTTHMQMQR
jgi:hypothetical protein